MNSNTDYAVHEVNGPHEISRSVPLSDKKRQRKRKPLGKRKPPSAPSDAAAEGKADGDQAPRGGEGDDDHAVDCYV